MPVSAAGSTATNPDTAVEADAHPNAHPDALRDGPLPLQLLPFLLSRASHLVSAEFYEQLRRRGISVRRWRMLGMLWDGSGLSLGALSEAILVEQSSTTRLVDRAVAEGLVVKRADPADRRRVTVTISEAGRAYIADVVADALRVDGAIAARHGPQKIAALKAALRDLIGDFEPDRW